MSSKRYGIARTMTCMRKVMSHELDRNALQTAAICTLSCGHTRRVVLCTYRKPEKREVPVRLKCMECRLAEIESRRLTGGSR